jgi:hypothetical protein
MTCYPFGKRILKRIIGTSGGWTKSTGYTFKNSDKNQVNWLPFCKGNRLQNFIKDQILVYDLLLLDILDRKKNRWVPTFFFDVQALIFKFLDRKHFFIEDIQVILKCQKCCLSKPFFPCGGKP